VHKTDLLTGSLTYENKFSLDAKPIEGGVRTYYSSDFLFRPTFTRASRTLDERKRSKNQIFSNVSVQRRSPRMKEEKLTFDVFFYRIEREQQ
jgi:hypothetical protein|tara:strand:+ start:250 stop:525 length:276 start_codon:yes stop_codon:yes gene_type:complete